MNHKDFTHKLAKQAGAIIREHFSDYIQKDWKKDDTPITKADQAINDYVVAEIRKQYPDNGIIAEEGGNTNTDAEYVWLCDPIDGTLPFSHAIPTSCFSLALVQDGKPIVGLLHDPFMDRTYYAEKGTGATLNNKPIKVSTQSELKNAVIGTVTWANDEYDFPHLNSMLYELNAIPINIVVTTYLGALVASGQLVANIFHGNKPWDTAAQKIIIDEAGGVVTDLEGHDQRYDQRTGGMLATNGLVHEQLLKLVQQVTLLKSIQ